MKKHLITLLALAALCLSSVAQESNRRVQVAAVAFYNFENLFDTIPNNPEGRDVEFTPAGPRRWDSRKYQEKVHNMAYAISQFKTRTPRLTPYGPVIIGISEIENRSVVEDVVNQPELKDLGLRIVHHDSPDARGVDVGMIYNPRFFQVQNVTNHRLSAVPFRTRDQMCVVGSLMGEQVAVIVNHWPSRLGGEERSAPNRMAAAELCKHIADSLWSVNPEMGVIIMGDLNDDPQSKSCAITLDAKKNREDATPHGFYNPWWKILDRGIGTLAYKSQWNLFDQIIISGNLANAPEDRWGFFKAEVLNFDFLTDHEGNRQGYPKRTFASGSYLGGYSDHYPTEILLRRYVTK